MTMYEVLYFLLGSTIVAISSSSDDMNNEVNIEDPSDKSVYWIVETNPVIFGRNVTLLCKTVNVDNVCIKCPERWYGGKERSLLSFKGYPSKNTKYVPTTDPSGFGIIITQFDKEDLNVNYSCSYGPYFDNKNLTEDMLHIKEESGDGDSSEQLTPFWIASVVVLTVVVCLGTGLLVFKKIRQYKLSKGHNSDGNIFSKNIENLPYINCYLETANNPTEKFSHQNSQDLQICSSDTLLPQESVSRSTVLSNDDSDIFISTLLVDVCARDDCENCMNKWSHAVGIGTSNTD